MALRKSIAQEYLTQPKQQQNCGGELKGPSKLVESAISHGLFGSPWVTAMCPKPSRSGGPPQGVPYAGRPLPGSRCSRGHLRGPCETGRICLGWRRVSGRANCRGQARSPPVRHSPWLRPRVAARPPPSLHSAAQLHLCAAAAAAKPGNILAGQRPPLGHRLLPPSRLPRQLTP